MFFLFKFMERNGEFILQNDTVLCAGKLHEILSIILLENTKKKKGKWKKKYFIVFFLAQNDPAVSESRCPALPNPPLQCPALPAPAHPCPALWRSAATPEIRPTLGAHRLYNCHRKGEACIQIHRSNITMYTYKLEKKKNLNTTANRKVRKKARSIQLPSKRWEIGKFTLVFYKENHA